MPNFHDFTINDFAVLIRRRSNARWAFLLTVGAWIFSGAWSLVFGASLSVVDLRCEYLSSPLGMDELQPRLSWRIESSERGVRQTAYEIVVASELGKIDSPDLWDSMRQER